MGMLHRDHRNLQACENTPQSAYTRRLYYAEGQLLWSLGPKQTSRIQNWLENLIRFPDEATPQSMNSPPFATMRAKVDFL